MTRSLIEAELLEGDALSAQQIAEACAVTRQWVVERVDAGLLRVSGEGGYEQWRFSATELVRVRCMVSIERDMDANPEVAALVADLIEEVHGLRRRLRGAGGR